MLTHLDVKKHRSKFGSKASFKVAFTCVPALTKVVFVCDFIY